MNEQLIRVGVVGASGYSGMELVGLLAAHPHVSLTYVAGTTNQVEPISQWFPSLHHGYGKHVAQLQVEQFQVERCRERCDMVFVALPSGTSGQIAAELWKNGLEVIDLSGDLRLPPETYEQWYRKSAVDEAVRSRAVYGLPEWNRDGIRDARLIANPGCYATAILLGLMPAIRKGIMPSAGCPVIVDAKSGVSGAGRTPTQTAHFAELYENFHAYRVGNHQHIPEIEQMLGFNSATGHCVVLNTQLLPVSRGIFATAYIPGATDYSTDEIYEIYQSFYKDEPFIFVHRPGEYPQLKHVRGTNACHIGVFADPRTGVLQVYSVIDNLQKGAAGQALQNFNLMHGFDEATGLERVALYP